MSERAGRVLIVEDDVNLGDLIGIFLSRHRFQVEVARTSEEALFLCARKGEQFDVAVLDLWTYPIPGEEVFRQLRKYQPGLPGVLVTGDLKERTEAEFQRLGFARVLEKPFEFDELVTCVQEAMT